MIEKTIAHIDSNRESYVSRLQDWLRIPSISTDPARKGDVRKAGEWACQLFLDCGFEAELVETAGHPAVIADSGPVEGGGPTLLVYGHYDVQPTGDDNLWHSLPFEPTIRDGSVVARGAADDKGQILAHMLAAEAWMKAAAGMPTRVKFLVEGEEEVGSAHLEELLRANCERLSCDYLTLSDTPKFDKDTPAITYGTKGLIYKEITVTGPAQDLHSGAFGGTVANPGNALATIIASLRDEDNRVTIPGFYDDVCAIGEDERQKMAALPFDEQAYLKTLGSPALVGEVGHTTLERRWVRPTLDVNGLFGGFTGEGASTIIPAKMMAKVSMRVVPNQDAEKISAAFDAAVRAATPPGVEVSIHTHAQAGAYVCPLESNGIKAATKAITAGFGRPPVYIREGGSLPILPLFKEVLGVDSLMLGFSLPNCNLHGPNEFFVLDDFQCGIKSSAHLMRLLGRVS